MASIRFDIPCTNKLCTLPIQNLNQVYAAVLNEVVKENDPSTSKSSNGTRLGIGTKGPVTRFHSKVPPPLEIGDYLTRLTKFTPFPRDALLLSCLYLNRISHLALSTAFSDSFTDPPPPGSPQPRPLVPSVPPEEPDPVMIVSPALAPSSDNSIHLPTFSTSPSSPSSNLSLSCSPPHLPSTNVSRSNSLSVHSPHRRPRSTSFASETPLNRKRNPAPLLNQFTLHRLVLSTLLISTKFTCDGMLSQSRAAKVGGVSSTELGRLEHETLRLLGWELYWSLEEVEGVIKVLEQKARDLGMFEGAKEEVESGQETLSKEDRPTSSSNDATSTGVETNASYVELNPSLPPSPPLPTISSRPNSPHSNFETTTTSTPLSIPNTTATKEDVPQVSNLDESGSNDDPTPRPNDPLPNGSDNLNATAIDIAVAS